MWALKNRTAYAVGRTWVRDKSGVHHWVVAVKACFSISTWGALTLADEQLPPRLEPEWYGEPGLSSLKYDVDLGMMKPSTDLTVLGTAYAPQDAPAVSVPVMLKTATAEKILVVYGERFYCSSPLGLSVTKPERFRRKPLRYEDAWGGTDTREPSFHKRRYDPRNPIGRGVRAQARGLDGQLAHSIEYAGTRAHNTEVPSRAQIAAGGERSRWYAYSKRIPNWGAISPSAQWRSHVLLRSPPSPASTKASRRF